MDDPPTVPEWDAMFAACVDDGDDPAEFIPLEPILLSGDPTDCVSFNISFTRIRVELPDQAVPTTFARVIGIDSLTTSAAAEVFVNVPPSRRGIPFAMTPGGGSDTDIRCVRLDTGCSGPTNQDVAIIDAPQVGNPVLGTTRSCGRFWSVPQIDGQPNSDATLGPRVRINAAMGFDHTIVVYDGGTLRTDDFGAWNSDCSLGTHTPLPNALFAVEIDNLIGQFGSATAITYMNGVYEGLVWGSGFPDGPLPRLRRDMNTEQRTITNTPGGDKTIDDRPLWTYIGSGTIPGECAATKFVASPTIQQMRNCLADWSPADGFLFDADRDGDGEFDIITSPRAGGFPTMGSEVGSQNYKARRLVSFEMGFINTMYFGTGTSVSVEYSAGDDPARPDVGDVDEGAVGDNDGDNNNVDDGEVANGDNDGDNNDNDGDNNDNDGDNNDNDGDNNNVDDGDVADGDNDGDNNNDDGDVGDSADE